MASSPPSGCHVQHILRKLNEAVTMNYLFMQTIMISANNNNMNMISQPLSPQISAHVLSVLQKRLKLAEE
jgi:hypothetical protein